MSARPSAFRRGDVLRERPAVARASRESCEFKLDDIRAIGGKSRRGAQVWSPNLVLEELATERLAPASVARNARPRWAVWQAVGETEQVGAGKPTEAER
jgi:hypothetical protein